MGLTPGERLGGAAARTPVGPADTGRVRRESGVMHMPASPPTSSRPPRRPPAGARDSRRTGLLGRIAVGVSRLAARRPRLTIVLWFALILACAAGGSLAGMRSLSMDASGTGESSRADARLTAAKLQSQSAEDVLVSSPSAARTRRAVSALEARARQLPVVASVDGPDRSPMLTRDRGMVALVVITVRGGPDQVDPNSARVERLVDRLRTSIDGASFQEAGVGSIDNAGTGIVDASLHRAELISVPITLVVLVVAFGALVAASVPLLLGLTSVGAALGALGLVSHIAPDGSSTAPVVVLIGLAVGIDYSLFYIRRERIERRRGATAEAALAAASATVGRAILVAGITVVIGLAGLLFTGLGVFTSMALGAILVVAIAVLGSLTVLPAMLALLGDRIDRGRLWPRGRGVARDRQAALWQRAAEAVTRRPRAALVAAAAALVALAAPVFSMQTANPGERDFPANMPVLVAEHAIERAFPGSSDSADLVVIGERLGQPDALRQLNGVGRLGLQITHGRGAVTVRTSRDGATALVSIPLPAVSLTAADRTVQILRARLERAVAQRIHGARAELTGQDAGNLDFSSRLASVTPIVIGFVVTLAFVLLLATFGSPFLALSVIALNLLSVGAAFGLLVAVFQHHWAQAILGFRSDGAVVDWLPLFAFVVLFGLSMDYTVLILERAREARLAGADARDAARTALGATGGTVTSAAVVMIAVFSVFATLPLLEFKQLGVGLAAAIALDATIVRGLALPAALVLLGDRGLAPARPRRGRRQRRGRGRGRGWDHPTRVAAPGYE